MFGLVFSLITMIAIAIIGVVHAPRAGAAKGRLWLGLGLLLASSVVGLIYQVLLITPAFFESVLDAGGHVMFGVIGSAVSVITGALSVAGIAILVSAITMRNQTTGYLDPTRPGAPPTGGYQGTGYPTPGSQTAGYPAAGGTDAPEPRPGANPYA